MQSKVFVFVGVPVDNPIEDLRLLMEKLNKKFNEQNIPLILKCREALLTGIMEEASFYVTLLRSRTEIKDYYEMAENFELRFEKKAVSGAELSERYSQLEKLRHNIYLPLHYAAGLMIAEEMEKINGIIIYAFQ